LIERSKTEIDKEWIVLFEMVLWLSWKQNGISIHNLNRGCYKKKCLNWLYLLKDETWCYHQTEDEKESHERIGKIISIVRSGDSKNIWYKCFLW
jgi:hypothetical protein